MIGSSIMVFLIRKIKQIFLKPSSEAGFTIIESMTAVFIFSIVAISIIAIFARTNNLNRRAVDMQRIQEEVVFVMELMVRDIRVSQICNTGPVCTLNMSSLFIEHPTDGVINYSLNTVSGIIEKNLIDPPSILVEVSSSVVNFTNLNFKVTGADTIPDQQQPKVTIVASIQSRNNPNLIVDLQTTITSRDVRLEFTGGP